MPLKIAVLTSSRADYGIYTPLLKALKFDDRFDMEVVAFGMHLLKELGYTFAMIEKDGYVARQIPAMDSKDSPKDITLNYARGVQAFASFYEENKYDWVIVLGDRFEMSAAVQAGIPFEVNFAHLHGGETTLGAIDNIYRHQITLASRLHFTATDQAMARVIQLRANSEKVFNVGSLSLEGIKKLALPAWSSVREQFGIPDKPFVLTTLHPETVNLAKNEIYIREVFGALEELSTTFHIIITLANADAMGSLYRRAAHDLKQSRPWAITIVENFGKLNYFAAMKASEFLLGNTSSGIIEAASFNKYVVNVGDRQAGRECSENIINVPFEKAGILDAARQAASLGDFSGVNIYCQPDTTNRILENLINEAL